MAGEDGSQRWGDGLELRDGDLTLRPPTADDLPRLIEAVQSSYDLLWPWMPWARDYDLGAAATFLELVESGAERAFLVLEDHGRSLAGVCGLNRHDAEQRTANLGYWLRTSATGRRLATRAARAVAVYGLRDVGLERVEVLASVDNLPSQRVARRLGFADEGIRSKALRIDGRQHDVQVFAALRSDLARLLADGPIEARRTETA